jgi:hypothetical protein
MRPTLVVRSTGLMFRRSDLTILDDLFATATGVHSVYVQHQPSRQVLAGKCEREFTTHMAAFTVQQADLTAEGS